MTAIVIPLRRRGESTTFDRAADAGAELARLISGLTLTAAEWPNIVARFTAEERYIAAARKARRRSDDPLDALDDTIVASSLSCLRLGPASGFAKFGRYDEDEYDSFEQYLLREAGHAVKARELLGIEPGPLAEVAPERDDTLSGGGGGFDPGAFPPVTIVPVTPQRRTVLLRGGAAALDAMITERAAALDALRRLATLVERIRCREATDEDRAEAFALLLPIEEQARGNDNPAPADEIMKRLGLALGVRVFATGGCVADWYDDGPVRRYGPSAPTDLCRNTVASWVASFGLAPDSPPVPPVPPGCEGLELP